jgi:acyl-CoA thioesterase-1
MPPPPENDSHVRGIGVIALCGLAVIALFWFIRQPDAPQAAKPTTGTSIIAFGDSLVSGAGATAGNDFVSVLSRRLGTPIINAGRGGDTTRTALARLDEDVLARNPRIVIVLLGGNDFLRRVPKKETFANLGMIVERIRARGAAVVLLAIDVGVIRDPYAEEYEALARRTSAALVPDVLDEIIDKQQHMADGIHPNNRGYRIVADRVEPVLRDLLE